MGNKFLPALESTRGLAALLVVCYHWKIAEVITKNGYLSVDLFFVISGYIIAKLYIDNLTSIRSFYQFILLRLGRIYPLHLFYVVCFLAGYFFIGKSLDDEKVLSLVSTIFLVNSANDITSWFNFASWSVSAEWISYLCFGVIFSQLATEISKSFKIIICVGIITLSYLWCNAQSSHSGLEFITQNAGWARGLGGFFGGTLGYLIWPKGLSMKNVSGILLVFFSFLFLKDANTSLDYSFIIVAIFLVAWLASEPAQHTFLEHPILLWIGKISYSIYLGHTFTGAVTEKLLGLTGLNINFYLVFLIKLGCLLSLSELTYRWIENPCRLFVRNYTNKKAAQ